jgi:hypothetical protein
VTSNDYIYAFKQFTLYKKYLQGGPPIHGLDRNELLLKKAQRSSDHARFVAALANYRSKSSFTNHLPHLKGEEVIGSTKQLAICPLGADNVSHYPNHVNFFHPRIIILVVKPNIMHDVRMQRLPSNPSNFPFVISQGGLKLEENICANG